ncbi:hypothetical protein EC960109_4998B, partial [Escherichia coli 96.0109]
YPTMNNKDHRDKLVQDNASDRR